MSDPAADGADAESAIDIPLGEVDPCGSRQAGRRSGVALTDDGPVAGLVDGAVRAFADDGAERWRVDGEGSAITIVSFADGVLVGERSARGSIRFIRDGVELWCRDAADAVGAPTEETRFRLPMVVDAAVADGTAYVAARRYERAGDGSRRFASAVYALAPDGTVRWRYDADASPISLATFDGVVAVAYNRCPGAHDDGLVVLDGNGRERWTWDPVREAERSEASERASGESGAASSETSDRRVGDVSAGDGGLVAASHADYRGYRLVDGEAEWSVGLGVQRPDGDRVYTYPNHVRATDAGAVFLTGNTFPAAGRETDERHPNEQTAFGYSLDGERRWLADVGGFSHGIGADGDRLLVPVSQHFRDRDPAVHGWREFDVADGLADSARRDGVMTAAALDGDRRVLVEEPVRYHDDGVVRGRYALFTA